MFSASSNTYYSNLALPFRGQKPLVMCVMSFGSLFSHLTYLRRQCRCSSLGYAVDLHPGLKHNERDFASESVNEFRVTPLINQGCFRPFTSTVLDALRDQQQ